MNGQNQMSREFLKRRQFLVYAGAGLAGVSLSLAGCEKNNKSNLPIGEDAIYLGAGDIALINLAYLLEQVEAEFYTQLMIEPYSGMSSVETIFFTEIRDQEIAHREFLKILNAEHIVPRVEIDFSSIDFKDRGSVFLAAKTIEDLSVAAYIGIGLVIEQSEYLLMLGKIGSVEARHSAWIREMISNGSFADDSTVDINGLNIKLSPKEAISEISKFILNALDTQDLPTN